MAHLKNPLQIIGCFQSETTRAKFNSNTTSTISEQVDVTKNLEKQIETLLKGQANLKQEMLLVRKEKVALESDLAAAKESAVASKEKLRVEAETNSAKLKVRALFINHSNLRTSFVQLGLGIKISLVCTSCLLKNNR